MAGQRRTWGRARGIRRVASQATARGRSQRSIHSHKRTASCPLSAHLQVEGAAAKVGWAVVGLARVLAKQPRARPTLRFWPPAAAAGACRRCRQASWP